MTLYLSLRGPVGHDCKLKVSVFEELYQAKAFSTVNVEIQMMMMKCFLICHTFHGEFSAQHTRMYVGAMVASRLVRSSPG